MWKEFKTFAMRGNVLDLAVGIIIGAAFGKIVGSLVADVLMPPLGLMVGTVDFKSLYIALDGTHYATLEAARKAGAPLIMYGNFLQSVVDFLIVAFVVFLLVQQVNRMKNKVQGPPPAVATKECPECLSVIPLKARRCSHCACAVP